MKGLSPKQVQEIMAHTRNRGGYDPKLQAFADSDEVGIDPTEVWPEFASKDSTTLYQGFLGAKKRLDMEDRILLTQQDGKLFILDKSKYEAVES